MATYLYKVIRRVRRIAGHHNALAAAPGARQTIAEGSLGDMAQQANALEVPERGVGVVWNAAPPL